MGQHTKSRHARRLEMLSAGCVALVILTAVATGAAAGAAPAIETAPQDPLIHPVAPEDGAVAVTNPPAMVFWHTPEAASYRLELSQTSDFADAIVVDAIALPLYNHTAALALGKWFWRYQFRTKDGTLSQVSRVRGFSVVHGAIPFPVPPVAQLLAKLPGHPRIYVTPDKLADFRRRRTSQSARAFAALEHACQGGLKAPLQTPEAVVSPPSRPEGTCPGLLARQGRTTPHSRGFAVRPGEPGAHNPESGAALPRHRTGGRGGSSHSAVALAGQLQDRPAPPEPGAPRHSALLRIRSEAHGRLL